MTTSTNLLKRTTTSTPTSSTADNPGEHKVKTMIVLGSGGHTTEMMRLLQELDPGRYAPVIYVVADSDTTSIPRLQKYIIRQGEGHVGQQGRWEGRYPAESACEKGAAAAHSTSLCCAPVHRLPRAREVHQSYLSSIVTTLHSFLQTLILLWKVQPELILANGPGTCVPVIYSAFLFRLSLLGSRSSYRCKVIFVESLCRVRTLSLSGKLVYPIVDRFVVHWPYLRRKYPMVEVCDVLVRHDGH
eukprot:CAMPEP_0172314650 /NCGR_PEP_ID=MMETSP1058-20130122/23040_1 /TAXON_ID=83371 /ORGANISM="Detonula confervacea, Strain CCMP 353" /LENGTH=243 /DNA_ID=CAMNT_0013028571 /DNA_START=248 /DNA_END=979 /DNA_ORIENTATION=-